MTDLLYFAAQHNCTQHFVCCSRVKLKKQVPCMALSVTYGEHFNCVSNVVLRGGFSAILR